MQNLFKLLDRFEKISAMWIGSWRDKSETPQSLKWCKTVKALGLMVYVRQNKLLMGRLNIDNDPLTY